MLESVTKKLTHTVKDKIDNINKKHIIVSKQLGSLYHVPTIFLGKRKNGYPIITDELYHANEFNVVSLNGSFGYTAAARFLMNPQSFNDYVDLLLEEIKFNYKQVGIDFDTLTAGDKLLFDFVRDSDGYIKIEETVSSGYIFEIEGSAVSRIKK